MTNKEISENISTKGEASLWLESHGIFAFVFMGWDGSWFHLIKK